MQRAATLDKGLDILEAVAAGNEQGVGIRELARRIGTNPTTAHNLVWTLCTRGYLRQEEQTRRFQLGAAFLPLTQNVQWWRALAQSAEPLVSRCREELDESIMLALLEHTEVLTLIYQPSSQALRVHEPSVMGARAYGTAVGKMMLAVMPEEALALYLKEFPPQPFTAKTLATPDAIREELARVRHRGYAQTRDELTVGVSAIAVPIDAPGRKNVAALGASAPTIRMDSAHAARTLDVLQRHAQLISRAWFSSRSTGRGQGA